MERQAKDGTFYKKVGSDEWEPVTREAKNGTVYKKVGQDEWEPLEGAEVRPSSLNRPAEEPEKGFLGKAIDTVVEAGETVDSYTGAPARAAIGAMQEGENPFSAAYDQFGEDPSQAPTGQELARGFGVSDTSLNQGMPEKYVSPKYGASVSTRPEDAPSASGAVGLGIEMMADPLMAVPGTQIARGISRGGKSLARGGVKVAQEGGQLAKQGVQKIPGVKAASEIIDETASNTSEALKQFFKPDVAEDAESLFEIARKNNIDPNILPEAVEFGENSFISRASRNRAEGPTGQKMLERFQEAQDAVQEATRNKIAQFSGGSVPTNVEAGTLISEGYNKAVDELFNGIDFTYNNVIQQAPGIRLTDDSAERLLSKLNGIEKYAKGRIKRGLSKSNKARGRQLIEAVEAVREGNGSLKQVYEAMQDIGDLAFKAHTDLTDVKPDTKKLRELYFALRDEFLESTAFHLGDDVADELVQNNQRISDFIKQREPIEKLLANENIAPEKLFKSLVENGDTNRLKILKDLLPPDDFNKLKGAFLNSQIRENADNVFSFKTLYNRFRNKKDVMSVLLEPQEIAELGELVRLGNRMGDPVLSYSGTGSSNLFRDLGQGIRSGVENDAVVTRMKQSARNRQAAKNATPSKPSAKPVNNPPTPKAGPRSKNLERLANISPVAARMVAAGDRESGFDSAQLKGKNKWAVDGFAKLIGTSDGRFLNNKRIVERIFKSQKGKTMLMRASDLKQGSPAMQKIIRDLKTEFGGK